MKIAIINNLYTPFERGGTEKIVAILKQELEHKNHKVIVISTKPHNKNIDEKAIYRLNSIFYNIDKIPYPIRLFWHIWDTFNFINYFKIKKILRKENINLVISNNLKGIGLLTPLAIKKLDIKHIHILHDIQLIYPSGLMFFGQEDKIDSFFSKIYQKITTRLFNSIDKVVSPSKWLIDIHNSKGLFTKSEKYIIENPIFYKQNKSKQYQGNKKDFIFLYVGQIEQHKGIIFLVNMFKKNKLNLKIIGDGSERKNLQLSPNIQYLGKKTKEEVQIEMQKADCLIVPSTCYENSPTVIFEALNTNTMILASNIGGIPDILNKTKNNFLFQPNSEKDFNKKIEQILQTQCTIDNYDYLNKLTASIYIKNILTNIN